MTALSSPRQPLPNLRGLIPGVLLCALVSALAFLLEHVETRLSGHAWMEALVLAILIGTLVRTVRPPKAHCDAGIQWSGKTLLEIAVALMGATISFSVLAKTGLPLIAGIVFTVFGVILASFLIGRMLGLPNKMAVLIACGNAICGNSAIAAVAPAIDAHSDDVAAAIAFTAVLGVAVVVLLPFGANLLHLSPAAGGTLAGLTVYAVPQVIAAAAPLGTSAVQVGTLVKLIRVLTLGPVVAILSMLHAHTNRDRATGGAMRKARFVPGFIIAFLALAALRSAGLIPDAVSSYSGKAATLLTIVSMAGLGLSVNLRSVSAAGPRVTAAVILSLLFLTGCALALMHVIGLN